MAPKLIFLRHGESSANASPEERLLPAYDDDQVPLTALGHEQAKSCRLLMTQQLQIDLKNIIVYTSPKLRAIQTAEILGVSDHHVIDARLKE